MKKLLTILLLTACSLALTSRAQAQVPCTGPPAIPDNTPAGVDWTCNVPSGHTVADITIDVDITHTWVGDLQVSLTSPSATTVLLADGPNDPPVGSGSNGCSSNNMVITFDDAGTDGSVNDCVDDNSAAEAYINGGSYTPQEPLSGFDTEPTNAQGTGAFKGETALGVWTVNVSDNLTNDTGTVNSIVLNIATLIILPVELTRFDAVLNGDVALLSWETASETNNTGFEVQREIVPELFETLGFVEGAGTTSEVQSYSFRAADLGYGTHRFRLKQIDYDGNFEYSEIVEVTRELAEGYMLSPFYPNPFNPRGTFTLFLAKDQHVKIEVYNMMGQLVDVVAQRYLAAQQTYTFDFTAAGSLPSGQYILQVTGELFAGNQRITLLK